MHASVALATANLQSGTSRRFAAPTSAIPVLDLLALVDVLSAGPAIEEESVHAS